MIEIRDLRKAYDTGGFVQKALDGVSLVFRDSELVAVLGTSGSGKTTLLNALGGLDRADSGDIVVDGVSTSLYTFSDWDTYRNHHIGFVFQSYNLIPHQSVLSNVELALTLSGVSRKERKSRALEALERVGLAEHASKRPAQLSGGQAQRVAIARAIVNNPDVILADEPTGALDTETGIQIMEILSEIAKDHLVVMVTHNPDLAEEYATRIVRLKDGRIIDDTAPFDLAVETCISEEDGNLASDGSDAPFVAAVSAASASRKSKTAKNRKARMGFLTALGLSFSNLMTKKGRTFMTAFAGSIGIIGIAAILSLSNGVNNYILDTEEEALVSYPLTITKSSLNISSLLGETVGYGSGDAQLDDGDGDGGADSDTASEGEIPQSSIMSDMFAQVQNNDLRSFKEYIESDDDPFGEYVNAIQYRYDLTPLIYKSDTSKGAVQLNPSSAGSSLGSGLMTSAFSAGASTTDSFSELIDDEDMVHRQLELAAGEWPDSYDECLLVLNRAGEVSDYTLYSLGVYDTKVLNTMMEDMLSGNEVDVPEVSESFTYEDALSLTFKVLPRYRLYDHNVDAGLWSDISGDAEKLARVVKDKGFDLKVVGVAKPAEDFSGTAVSEGIAYLPQLTYELMERAANSEVIKQQQAHPHHDVFTGKTFEELEDEQSSTFDMESLFSIDESALANAFSMDASALDFSGMSLDMGSLSLPDVSGLDASALSIDSSALASSFSEDALRSVFASAPKLELSQEDLAGMELTEEQQAALDGAVNEMSASFTAWMLANSKTMPADASGYAALFREYMADPDSGASAILEGLADELGDDVGTQLSSLMQGYLQDSFAPYISSALSSMMENAAAAMANQMANAMASQMQALTASYGTTISNAISGQLSQQMAGISEAMREGFSFDASAFADAIHVNLSQEDLANLLQSYMSGERASCESNLVKLGYADRDEPKSISLYAKDFAAKQSVLDAIDAYNDKMRDDGEEEGVIQYSDLAGILMSSVTDIVDTISMVLIAFVSISLVVSSIMIGIITYISVLERRKEIGILRAMGASKGNIASVFNAETIIEGAISGLLAIAAVVAASFPVNAVVEEGFDVPNIMSLPPTAAAILVAVSIGLTFIAGMLPSQSASRKDPVEALRSE